MNDNTKDYYIRENRGSIEDMPELNERIRSNIIWGIGGLVLAGTIFALGEEFIQNDIIQNVIGYGATGISGIACSRLLKNVKAKSELPTITKQENPKQYKK